MSEKIYELDGKKYMQGPAMVPGTRIYNQMALVNQGDDGALMLMFIDGPVTVKDGWFYATPYHIIDIQDGACEPKKPRMPRIRTQLDDLYEEAAMRVLEAIVAGRTSKSDSVPAWTTCVAHACDAAQALVDEIERRRK